MGAAPADPAGEGPQAPVPPEEALYSFRDVAGLLGLEESRLRYWAQTGFVGPSVRRGGRQFYTFLDLVTVRAARDLLANGLTLQRARRNLEELRAALPALDRPLLRLRVCSDGEHVVVLGEGAAFEPSGQVVMDFTLGALAAPAAPVERLRPAPRSAEPAASRSAYGWFLEGLASEAMGDAAAAERAFRAALKQDPRLAAAHTNLGRLAHGRGERGRAREHFEKALDLDPEQPEARFDLANLHDEEGETELALAEYRRVLASAPDFADAHFNLGRTLLGRGERAAARRHLERYLEADPASGWAEEARALLEELSAADPEQ